ncbi:MAG: hypothetical protein JZU63_05865 [Rhodoferax sp.]|nr:hypothetical protein [Rhodoferax sp.]
MDTNSKMQLCVEEAAKIVQGKHEEFPGCESVLNVEAWTLSGTNGQFSIQSTSPSTENEVSVVNWNIQVKSPAAGGSVITPGTTLAGGSTVRGTILAVVQISPPAAVATTVNWKGLAAKFSNNGTEFDIWVYGSTVVPAGEYWGSSSSSTNTSLPT